MSKNQFALTPPMGWNSYDYYATTVNEEQIRKNAEFMAEHMKAFGWEYIVIDIEWYAYGAGSRKDEYQYIPFSRLAMDEYSRLIPCPERFPSSVGGKGFAPLAEYIHQLGLKFGIHIMRGIPRQAAHNHTAILGCDCTADELADPANICFWNPDMYGVRTEHNAAQKYYDSLFKMYAEWGVDFVKCDDICRMDEKSSKQEIIMIHNAIMKTGRPMVLSLSPGPALIEEAWHYEKYANMWRITDDFWDDWELLKNMFERCEIWQNHVSVGNYPDCDMLPLGILGGGFGKERPTRFSYNEQITMMTLWCIFRAPLMLGAEMTMLDGDTLKMLTNKDVIGLLQHSKEAKQLERDDRHAIWTSIDTIDESRYLALFNLGDEELQISFSASDLDIENLKECKITDLWRQMPYTAKEENECIIPAHGAVLYKVERQ